MNTIVEKITELIKEMLQGWVMSNLEGMFTDVNTKVGTIAGEVSQTPSAWNAGIFNMIKNLSDTVIIPIAGIIITYVLCYELITMVIDKNNMHEFDTSLFFRYLFKACIAVMLLSKTSDIVMAIFDVGGHMVSEAASAITGSTSLDVGATIQSMFSSQLSTMEIGELIGLGIETMFCSFCMKIMSVLITVILYGRMIEIYLYVSVAPMPFATLVNREWGSIGSNYIKGCIALAFQGFFIMVCVAIYAVLVNAVTVASNLHSALWQVMAYATNAGNGKRVTIYNAKGRKLACKTSSRETVTKSKYKAGTYYIRVATPNAFGQDGANQESYERVGRVQMVSWK